MYRLLIVEDEDMLREALIHSVPWRELGYDAREAADGAAALELARAFAPDIVLTDIRMPHMDGLQLAAHLREDCPEAVVAILSGHDEFAYAQEALKLGVREYITKPIVPDELIAVVRRLSLEVDRADARVRRMLRMQRQLEQSVPLLRQRLLTQLVESSVDADEAASALALTGLRLAGASYTVCLIDCDFGERTQPRARALLECAAVELAQAEVRTDAVAFELPTGDICLIYCARTKGDGERAFVVSLLSEVRQELLIQLDLQTTAAVGVQAEGLGELHRSYQSALETLRRRAVLGNGLQFDALDDVAARSHYPFDEVRLLHAQLKLGARDGFKQALDRFFDALREQDGMSEENLRVVMIDVMNGSSKLLLEADAVPDAKLDALYKRLLAARTLDEHQRILTAHLLDAHSALDRTADTGTGKLIEGACAYIQENYMDSALSLNSVATHVHISPTYLSILMKKKLCTTFSEYLIGTRLEKAKELLRISNLRTYEVATQTGYNDPQYFSNYFKKYTGLTPTEYRARCQE